MTCPVLESAPPASLMATQSVTHDHVAFLRRVEAALADGTDPATAIAGFPDDEVIDTALQALQGDLPRLLSALIELRGVDVNGIISHEAINFTPLGIASCLCSVRCVAALISLGADVNLQHPISHAVIFSHMLCVKALPPNADLTHADAHGMTLLHQAVVGKTGPDVLEAVLSRNVAAGLVDIPTAKAHHSDKQACLTALMVACMKYEHAQLLLQAGASDTCETQWGPCRFSIASPGSQLSACSFYWLSMMRRTGTTPRSS